MSYRYYRKRTTMFILFILILIFMYLILKAYPIHEGFDSVNPIPRHIWQTYKTKTLPASASKLKDTWTSKNPDWEYHLYDDNDIEKYIKDRWNDSMYSFFKALPIGVMKADLWRYLILTTHGGVYSDIDSECIIPIDKWFHDFTTKDALVLSPEKGSTVHFCQWTIYTTKEHPAMRFICNYILDNYEWNGIDMTSEHFVHETTGPGVWTEGIRAFLKMPDLSPQELYESYKKDSKPFIEKGIYILPIDTFDGIYTKNMYGSQFFNDGYVKWIDERDKLKSKSG